MPRLMGVVLFSAVFDWFGLNIEETNMYWVLLFLFAYVVDLIVVANDK